MFHALLRPRLLLVLVLVCGPAAAAVAQPGLSSSGALGEHLLQAAATGARVVIEDRLAREFAAMRAAVRDPVLDPDRLRRDPAYRVEHEIEVRKVAERRKQLALQFLDRNSAWLEHGAGRYYRGMALRLVGEDEAALRELQEFRTHAGDHPLLDAALLEVMDCLLSSEPDFVGMTARLQEEQRLSHVRRLLKKAGRRRLGPDATARVEEIRRRLAANELRFAYHELVAEIEDLVFEEILANAEASTRKRMMEDPMVRKGLRRLADPDEAAYYLDIHRNDPVQARRIYWRVRGQLQEKRQELVGRFYRAHRDALDACLGLIWKARALRLADDRARAIEAYAAFRARCGDRPEAIEAGIEQVRLLIRERDDLDAAERVLAAVETGPLDDEQRASVSALRAHVRTRRGQARARSGRVGKPFGALTGVGRDGETLRLGPGDGAGHRTVILGFAAWSRPAREALAAFGKARRRLEGWRVIGVTRLFGFGWSPAPGGGAGASGQSTGPGLDPAQERSQVAALWRAAGAPGPLLFVGAEDAAWLTAYPTAIEVDAEGRVVAAVAGTAAVAALLDRISGSPSR